MRKSISFLASAGLAVMPMLGHAATPTVGEVLEASGITAAGYVDAGYSASNLGTNSFELNQVALTIAKQPAEGFGGLVNLSLGEDAKYINARYGDAPDSTFALTQAYVQYVTGGLTVIGGRLLMAEGTESIDQTKDANISRSLLFANLQPLVQTGVRATYKLDDQIAVFGGVSNNTFTGPAGVDNNPQKAVEIGIKATPLSNLNLALMHARDTSGTGPDGRVDLTDFVASLQATKALSFGLNADYAHVPSGATEGVVIKGVALYSSYQFCDKLKGSLRGEYVKGQGDSGFNNMKEVTYTVGYAAAKNFDLLGEVRYDRGSPASFSDTNGAVHSGTTSVGVKALYTF